MFGNINIGIVSIVAIIWMSGGCVHTAPAELTAPQRAASVDVRAESVAVPAVNPIYPGQVTLKIPPELLDLRQVKRPKAEIRLAPQTAHKVDDHILTKNDRVLAYDQRGVWVKIIALDAQASGWVHRNALETHIAAQAVEIPSTRLPRVFAIRDVRQGAAYKTNKPVDIDAKKGTAMLCLRKLAGRVLVLNPANNSVVWFSQQDVQ